MKICGLEGEMDISHMVSVSLEVRVIVFNGLLNEVFNLGQLHRRSIQGHVVDEHEMVPNSMLRGR